MKSEHNLSIEQLQLIKLIENINQKYRQRCNTDKNKVLSDTNLKMLKSILPGLIILYKWNQEKKDSSINLEELIDQQLIKYRRLQNILNKKINITATDKTNYSFKKDKNLVRLEYLAKIIKFISQEKTIQKKIRDLKVSENDCMAILDKLNKLSYKIKKSASKEKLQTSKYLSAILSRQKSLEKTGINYLEDIRIENLPKTKSQLNTNESDRIVMERNPTIITNALHTIQNINKEEQEKAFYDCKTRIMDQERQYSLEKNNDSEETLLMYENKDKVLSDSSDGSCNNFCGSSIDNNQSIYSSSIFVTCNETEDNNNPLISNATSNTVDDNYTKIQKRKQLINDYSYVLSIRNDNKNNGISSSSQSQIECSCNECQEGNWMRLRGGKTKDSICFCPQCLCENCAGKGRSKACNCGKSCTCNPCGDTNAIEEILSRRIANTRMKCLKDTQPIYPPCSCSKDECPCNPCNDPQRAKSKCRCNCSVDGCKCNPCKCTPCNDPKCNTHKFQCFCAECYCNPCKDPLRKKRSICDEPKLSIKCMCPDCECNPCSDPRKKPRSVCDDTTCENRPPKPAFPTVCACPNCECNECSDPSCRKTRVQLNDLSSLKSTCNCRPNACNCNPCKCDPCNDPVCNKPYSRKNLPICACPPGDACKCDPCSDPSRNKPTKCFCPEGSCPCDPCADPTRSKKPNKCFCPEGSCPCDPCADPTRAKLNKCLCPEDACQCEKCTDPTRIKRIDKKCNCPEDNCQCTACTDPTRANKPQRVCACPIDACPCKACGDPTRAKPKPCNCPEGACNCDNCTDPTRAKAKPPKKCNCPDDSCLCKSCGDLERLSQMQAKNKPECFCPKESCPCEKCADPTRPKHTKCHCPENACTCEKCADPARSKPKACSCPEDSCPCEECQDPTRTKKCKCDETFCPCETCEDPKRAERNRREKFMKNDMCGCPDDACQCEACADPSRVKPKKCSCPAESCSCEDCGDPDRAKKKCMCPQDDCTCEDCGDPTRKKKLCSCPEEYCPCEECGDKNRAARNKEIHSCNCEEDTCLCNPCSDPTRAKRNKCSCPKDACSCENCGDINRRKKPNECTCPKDCCPCDPCKDPTRQKKIVKCNCAPNACTCTECQDPTIKKPYNCSCTGECTCDVCNDPIIQAKKLKNELKKCDCIGECNCNPCEDPTKKVCTCKSCKCVVCSQPQFKKEKYCTCKSCLCIECSDPKYQKKKFCTCQPQCECKYCSLPRKTMVHSITSLYKSAVSIVCDRISALMDKTCSANESCNANSVKSQNDKEICIIYQPNRHPACTCEQCICDPCCPTVPEPAPLPTEMLCVCDVVQSINDNTLHDAIPNAIFDKTLPNDCTCDKCTCDPCVPPPKEQPGGDTCSCPSPCTCCGTCNRFKKERSALTQPQPPEPRKNEICLMEGCTCIDRCCCDPCKPKAKNMSKCKCIGKCKCNACAKTKKQIPEGCNCDNCTCDPCKPQVRDESNCVCGQDTCDCDACLNQETYFKTYSSANAPPSNVPQQRSTYDPSDCNANKHNEDCTCGPFCICDEHEKKQSTVCDTKIPCECFECKCQKWQDNKHEFCCICDDKNLKCDFKCTCGEHCLCETQITVPVKDTLLPSDCTCDPCTCDPCFTKGSQMEKILSRVRTDPSNRNNSSSLPCSCQPMCRCGDCFNENVTKVHSYSDKKTQQQKNDCDLAQNLMIIKADEIQINEICNCCKCSDKNNKARDQQQQQQTTTAENSKKRSEKLQENEQKNEKQSIEEKKRLVAVIKSVCEKTQQNNEKQQQRIVAVINSSCQKSQQKIEIQEEQQRVVAVINSRCHKPTQYTEKQQLRVIEEKPNVCHPGICEKRKQKLVEVMSTCLNEEIQLQQYKMQQKQKHAVVTKKSPIIYPCRKVETNPCAEVIDPCQEAKLEPCQEDKIDSCQEEKIDPCQEKKVNPCQEEKVDPSQEEKVDPCQEKVDPCQEKVDPCQEKVDPCQEEKVDPCQEEKVDPCQEKVDPCQEEKVDPCQEEKVDPCQEEIVDPCQMDPCCEKQKIVPCVIEKIIYPIQKIDPCQKEIYPCRKEKIDPCQKEKVDPCRKEKVDPCRKEKADPCRESTPACLEEQVDPCLEEQRIEPYKIVREKEEPCYTCDNDGYTLLKTDVCLKLKSKFHCIKAYFGDYFSELIKSRAKEEDEDDECTCDICKCRREIRHKHHKHKSTITQDCACSSACKDVGCSNLSNDSTNQPCCSANVPKSEQCLAIINSKKTLSTCTSRKAIPYSEICSAVEKVDCNTSTRGLGSSYLDEYYYSENIQKDVKSIHSREENLMWTKSSKDKNSSFIELYDYKQKNKGLQAMADDDDNDNREIVSQTYSPVYNLERKYNQELRINDTENTAKSDNPMKKYTHQQMYCVDIKNDTQNLKIKLNQHNKVINHSSYLFKNVKSLHSSITDLGNNEWDHKNNSKFDTKIIRTNNNLLTTNEYRYCKKKSTDTVELNLECDSSYTTAVKSVTPQYSDDENNWYFINMQGVVPMSDNMDYNNKYREQYGQPIMVNLSGQLSAKLSESINNLHSSKNTYEKFVSDSKRVGINIPFVSNKSRKIIQSHSRDLKCNDSSHIPQREHENLRKTPQSEKSESMQPSRFYSQNNDLKNNRRDNTSNRHDLKNMDRNTINKFNYTQDCSIRKRGGAIPKDNIKNKYSRKTELNRYSRNGDRENSRGQLNEIFFRQDLEPIRDRGILNNEREMGRHGNQSDLMPELNITGSICVSEDPDGLVVEPEQSSCYDSSLSSNDRIYDHDKTMNKADRNNNSESGKIIDELYLNKARNDSSKIIDTKNDLTEIASYNTNKVSFCSAIANTPHRSMSLGGIISRNSTEYDRLEHNYHFARGGGYNPKTDNKEINDLDYENSLVQAYSGIIRKTIKEIPETGTLSENKYYSTSNLNNYNTSTADVRKSSPMFIDDYILVNRARGLIAAMSNAQMVPDHDLYTDSFESASGSESKVKEQRECAAKKFLEDQNLPDESPDQVDNTEQKKEKNIDHCEECTCRICVCGDCNCKICECEKGVKEEYERMKKEKEITEEKAKYCTCYICECNECNCIKCECDTDKFPQGIPLSKVVCPCTNCNCGIPCKEGALLKASKFFLTRDNDLFNIPDNVNQDMKVKILNAAQNVNVDIKFAIKNTNLQVGEAMNVADKMVQDAVLQLCKMDIEIKDVKNAIQTPFGQSTKPNDLSNNEIELLIASDDEKLKDTIIHANKHVIDAVSNARHSVTDAIWTANRNLESAMFFLLPREITNDNASFTEAKAAIDDSDGNKGNQQSSNQQPPNPPPNSNEKGKSTSKKGNCDCPYPCKCEDCPDQPHEPPPCDCPEPCECVGCPTLNIPVKNPHCRCKTCLCDPCLDKKRKKGSPIEKFLCGCKPECICEKCPAKPGCECEGECVCAVCPHKERKCDCAICLCNDCAAFKQVQQLCDCPQCLCNVCEKGGGVIPTKPPKLIYNVKCKCAVCLCDNCASDKIQATCSCPICLCDKCPEMEGKPAFECSCYPQCTCDKCSDPNVKCVSKRQKEEPYKCTCAICYCEKCSDSTKKRQDPCGEEHPKDCTCLKCTCSPCLSKKQKITECKCEKCKCNPCKMVGGMLPDCKCNGECKCINCQYKTANIDECTCKTCECNKKILCTTGAASTGDEIRKIELSECTCEPCNCNPCLAQGRHPPKCKCPKCMCTKCDIKQLPTCDGGVHPPDCKCNICYCAPCKYGTDPNCDKTFRLSCTCEVCSCKPCKAKGDSCDDVKKLTTPTSCKCIKCECFPCILPRNAYQGINIDKNLPTCLCGDCTCNPCMAAPPDICNEPREPPKYVPDCSCPECFCDPCAGKEPVNPCDLMKIDTTVVCTCAPKCDCNPCTLPPAVDPREAKPDHPETCKCAVCVCTQCELSKKILQPLIVDHSDDCQCRTCLCKPCKLKPDHNETRLDKINQGPKCKCKVCCCSPCKLETSQCNEYYSNLPDCVCIACSCDPCKAKPKNCETCPECFGKGDCKCLHCECVPCTKTHPEFCNCELCRCTNCLPLATKKFIPNCNCLLCLCKQPEQDPINQLSICQAEDDETKKCPVICPLNATHKKTGRKKCSCSICYCDPCQPVVSGTKFEYTFKPPENNPLEATLKVNEQKKCLCEPCLCKTCPKRMDKKKCSCYICKCENCSFKQNEENDLTCRCSRPCPCISCKGRGGAGSGNITTENIDHVRGGATTSNSEIQSVEEEIGGETKCSCADPCVCQSCAGEKFQRELKKCNCPAPCTCEHCPDTYNKAYLCTCYGTCTCRSCPATQHESLLKCNPNDKCLCLGPCCCIDCSGKKHLNKTDNNECTCKNLCTCETCISKSNERRKLLNQIQDDHQVPCDCEKPCTCAVCLGNTGLNFVHPFGQPAKKQETFYDVKNSENDLSVGIKTSENMLPTCTFPICQIIPNITHSICSTMLDNESHVTCDKPHNNETYDATLSDNDKHGDAISVAMHDNKDRLEINKYFDDETNNIMITETKSDKRNYEEDIPPCACTNPCVSACLHSSHQANHTTNVQKTQSKTDECNIVKKLTNQISSLITKPFQISNTSNHPSAVSTAINNLLNCDCPIPCLCPGRDQCGTYQFMNAAEKDTSTKRSNTMGKISSNKTQLHSETQIQTKKRCNCVGICRCSTPQIGLTQKQQVSETSKYPSNRNSPTDTRVSNQKSFSTIYQPKRTCDCVGSCKCFNEQFGNNQKPSVDITKRISANFKQINGSSKKQIDKMISSKSQNTQFRIFETRKLTEDSLLIKWTPANVQCLTGYEIDVNGSISHRVRNKDRCVAVLFNICYDKPVNISVFAMSRENRNHPPAFITVC